MGVATFEASPSASFGMFGINTAILSACCSASTTRHLWPNWYGCLLLMFLTLAFKFIAVEVIFHNFFSFFLGIKVATKKWCWCMFWHEMCWTYLIGWIWLMSRYDVTNVILPPSHIYSSSFLFRSSQNNCQLP